MFTSILYFSSIERSKYSIYERTSPAKRVLISPMSLRFDRKAICKNGLIESVRIGKRSGTQKPCSDRSERHCYVLCLSSKKRLVDAKKFTYRIARESNTFEKRWFSIFWAIAIFRDSGRTFSRTFLCCI